MDQFLVVSWVQNEGVGAGGGAGEMVKEVVIFAVG